MSLFVLCGNVFGVDDSETALGIARLSSVSAFEAITVTVIMIVSANASTSRRSSSRVAFKIFDTLS